MLSETVMQTYINNIKERPYENSIEYPGYLVSYHPKPKELMPREWFNILSNWYTSQGHIVLHKLAAVEYEKDEWDPYPLENKVKHWGIEIIYR
jgi:hypothetical protein